MPELLHLDNAPEFKSEALERGTRENGIKLLYRPIGGPHFGGHIERLIGTVMGAVHLLPAATGALDVPEGPLIARMHQCSSMLTIGGRPTPPLTNTTGLSSFSLRKNSPAGGKLAGLIRIE